MIKSTMLIEGVISNLGHPGITNMIIEEHNKEYEGMLIQIDNHSYRSRLAKATPRKRGYFVVKTASQTQKWQQDYFIDLTDNLNQERLEDLYFN